MIDHWAGVVEHLRLRDSAARVNRDSRFCVVTEGFPEHGRTQEVFVMMQDRDDVLEMMSFIGPADDVPLSRLLRRAMELGVAVAISFDNKVLISHVIYLDPSQPVNGAALDFGIVVCSVNADILEEEFFAVDKT